MESATQRKRASKAAASTSGPASPATTASMTSSARSGEELDYDDVLDDDDDDLDAFLSDEDLQAAVAAEKERYSELRRRQKRRKQRLAAGRFGSVSWLLQGIIAGCASLRSASSFARVLLGSSFLWLLAALLWLRWPIYIQTVAEPMAKALGDKQKAEVEPRVVIAALALPFAMSGALFYWLDPSAVRASSGAGDWRAFKWLQWLRRQRRAHFGSSVDSTDVAAIAVFCVVQLNCFVGKLLIDQYTGKLAKAGLLPRAARTFGMNGLYAMILSIVLVSRQSFVLKYLRVSSERAGKYHVWSSNAAVLFLLLHGALYGVYWLQRGEVRAKLLPCRDCSSVEAYKTMRNFAGLVALALLLGVALASLERVRRRHFRRFALAHCVNVLVVVFTCVHYYPAAFWLAPSVLVYALYRVVARFGQGSASVISSASLADKVVQLELRRDGSSAMSDFQPGQYVYLKVDDISRSAWHPFTISSSPLRNRYALHVDAKVYSGGFTRALLERIKSHRLTTVRVDGYYGAPIAPCAHMIFVAGGSGMTPFLSALEHLQLQSERLDPSASAPAASSPDANAALTFPKTLWVIWTCRDVELLEAHAELLQAVSKSTRWRSKIWLHVTPAAAHDDDDDDGGEPSDDMDDCGGGARVEKFFPTSTHRHAYARDASLAQPFATFVGACVGMALSMYSVYTAAANSAVVQIWWCKRVLLLVAGVLGAAAGGSVVLLVRHAVSRRREQDSGVGSAVTELECAGLDLSSPVAPQTPRKHAGGGGSVDSRTSLLHRSFSVAPSRPDVQQRLRGIHSEIQETFGMGADVALFVSGPASLQTDVARHASALHSPLVAVHHKSFSV